MSRGTVPKVNRVRDVDGKRRMQDFRTIAADGQVHGPDLPDGDWPEATREMYEAIRTEPFAADLTPADWRHVIDTMALHRNLWRDEPANQIKVAAEVRLRLQSLGVTPEARMKMRLLVTKEPAQPSRLEELQQQSAARRRKLLKAVEESEKRMKA